MNINASKLGTISWESRRKRMNKKDIHDYFSKIGKKGGRGNKKK